MAVFRFEWDETKNRTNQRKHSVSFEEASQAFHDPLLFLVQDRVESGEQRWQAYEVVRGCVLVMVAHTIKEENDQGGVVEVIRIISARRATPRERRRYEEENG